jgi:hypothetical protein
MMYFVGRTHVTGGARWTVNRLAAELGFPGIAVAQMAATLERAGLLIVTDEDELIPGRDLAHTRVREIVELSRSERSGHVAPRALNIPPVDRVLAGLDEARRRSLGELTLAELVAEAPRPALLLTPRQSSSR